MWEGREKGRSVGGGAEKGVDGREGEGREGVWERGEDGEERGVERGGDSSRRGGRNVGRNHAYDVLRGKKQREEGRVIVLSHVGSMIQ